MQEIVVPHVIQQAVRAGATMALSISGGKDSQAMMNRLRILDCQKFAIHMDLGKAEWSQTPEHVEKTARENGLQLVVVRRPQGDLVDEIEQRMIKLEGTGTPFWPSSTSRYCTADQKRAQADKVYRQYNLIISCEGNRALESPKRSKDAVVSVRKQITAKALRDLPVEDAFAAWLRNPQQRLALTWYAIHDWTIDDVWSACGTSAADLATRRGLYLDGMEDEALNGWLCHPAYVFGNSRLSCAICILADDNDIRNGARHNPWVAEKFLSMERSSGITFKSTKSLAGILTK